MPILTASGEFASRKEYYKKPKKTKPRKPTRLKKPTRKAPISEAQATQILDEQLSRRLRTWI